MESAGKRVLPSLEELETMDGQQLRQAFLRADLGHLPKNASRAFLQGTLAWACQTEDAGHDFHKLRKKLLASIRVSTRSSSPLYKPGTRLVREWQGVIHEVIIEREGFNWNGEHFSNLSEIARTITGTRWSGPRFFGLKE